jgi:hypothetical protein
LERKQILWAELGENGETKSRILHETSLHHPSAITLWKNFED